MAGAQLRADGRSGGGLPEVGRGKVSKPRFRWWSYVIKMVRDFPTLNAADHLSTDDQRDRDAVARAVENTRLQPHGEQRLTLISSVYWGDRKHTVEEVAAQLSITDQMADTWHGDFVREVGRCWGFDINQPSKKRGPRPKKIKTPDQNGDRGEA